jgi:hypothetical protein
VAGVVGKGAQAAAAVARCEGDTVSMWVVLTPPPRSGRCMVGNQAVTVASPAIGLQGQCMVSGVAVHVQVGVGRRPCPDQGCSALDPESSMLAVRVTV